MAKESLVVHVRKLILKKYMKNHKIIFFFNRVEEKKTIEEELIPLLGLKYIHIYIGICTAFIVFMINLANLEINFQRLSLNLS